FPFYAGAAASTLTDLPVLDKSALLTNFAALNLAGLTASEALARLDRGETRFGRWCLGQSTGTSGMRSPYVISQADRFTWLGVILAKTMADLLGRRPKVALVLPTYGALYASAPESGMVRLRFFDLGLGLEAWRDEIEAYAPDVLLAPPKVLRSLAETASLAPERIFSSAEVLDPIDRDVIEARFGLRVREIYMATEGLFAVACEQGVLHLAEDVVAFEWEAADRPGLVRPVITDFSRRAQAMARYRMNDLLELGGSCACGSPLQTVMRVHGRQDDVFLLPSRHTAGRVAVTPDVVRNAVVGGTPPVEDFRAVQTGPARVELSLPAGASPQAVENARSRLAEAFERVGAGPVEIELRAGIQLDFSRKLRRVRRDWRASSLE
ncbi:MAG: adenylate-forming enzyme, partial [Caulobacteraceae bacterium]|nr:adenylate-forming enzyme [Caulobacteraceae bacterium]